MKRRRTMRRPAAAIGRPEALLPLCCAAALLAGCATSGLNTARAHFFLGDVEQAVETVAGREVPRKDPLLFLMERGLMQQAARRYEASSRDLIAASDLYRARRYSLSEGGASLVVNDRVQEFVGFPYEQTLLHAFTAHNHLALGHWNDAAVEARRIIFSLEPGQRDDFPDAAYARYMAAFCLELQDDPSNARLQYRKADELLADVSIDEATGRIRAAGTPLRPVRDRTLWPAYDELTGSEMVCFVNMGRGVHGAGNWHESFSPGGAAYAEFYGNGHYLGRSYPFTDTVDLRFTAEQHRAAARAVKTMGRVAVKEALAQAVAAESHEAFGDLVRMVLIGMLERPDTRHWETLPRRLQVARFPCPSALEEYEVVFVNQRGHPVRRAGISEPLQRHRDTLVSFCWDIWAK